MSTKELDEQIALILSSIPDHGDLENRREHSLTKADAKIMLAMVKLVSQAQGCSIGLSQDQQSALRKLTPDTIESVRDMVKERKKIMAVIGTGVIGFLAYIGKQFLDALNPDFWSHIFKH